MAITFPELKHNLSATAAMGGVIATPARFTLREQFTKRPALASEVTGVDGAGSKSFDVRLQNAA